MPDLSGSNDIELQVQPAHTTAEAINSAEANQALTLSNEVQPKEEVEQTPGVQNFLNSIGGSEIDFYKMEMKMHIFPLSLGSIVPRYKEPMEVAIGPYYHDLDRLAEMEKVKHVMAGNFMKRSRGCSPEELYAAVYSVAGDARTLYEEKDVADVSDADFAAMMSHDACFLLEYKYMLKYRETHDGDYPSAEYAQLNDALIPRINNDIMLLENQLPWLVIEKVWTLAFRQVEPFISQFSFGPEGNFLETGTSVLDVTYRPPHLLGLFLKSVSSNMPAPPLPQDGAMRVPSAIELAEIGIKLTASKTPEFLNMGFKKGNFFGEILLAPLNLDDLMSSRLVNMAAFEVCMATASKFREKKTDVCSYLRLLAMLMAREEDVHQLRKKGLVQGALTNQQTLNFFKGLTEHMYDSRRYACILRDIEAYRCKRWIRIKVYKFVYNNYKTIASVLSIIGALVGIFKGLYSVKAHRQ